MMNIEKQLSKTILIILCVIGFYSCSFPDDFIEPISTYKESVNIGDFLYQIEGDILSTFDISDPNKIILIDENRLTARVESFISFGGVLFIGAGGSLISYKIANNGKPTRDNIVGVMTFSPEQTECDLLVIDNDLAFVALLDHNKPNNICSRLNDNNTIQVYNIETLSSPILLSFLALTDLKDIGSDATLLFVSDGSNGFKIFDKSDPKNLVELYHFTDFVTNDVVINDGMLIVAGPTELRQYDYTDISDIREISRIEL